MKQVTENRSYFDIVQLVLGAGLFLSPWLFGFATEIYAAWHAWIGGVAIAGLAALGLAGQVYWTSWVSLVAGLWVLVAPWAVGFAMAAALWSHAAVGVVVALIALAELIAAHGQWPRVTA